MNRKLVTALVVVVVLLGGAYYVVGKMVYDKLSIVEAECASDAAVVDNTPADFEREEFDTSTYLVENYEDVRFPSRQEGIEISGWFAPVTEGEVSEAPAVIIVHGLGSCKNTSLILTNMGMLHRNGYNTLAIDMRDHGFSTVEDGHMAGGSEEYLDVLGAWDWLISEKGISEGHIGLMGFSLGAATVTIATGEEPGIAATWADSGFADVPSILKTELERAGFPEFLGPIGMNVGKLISGDDLGSKSPLAALDALNGRPFFIVHGDADSRINVSHAADLGAISGVEPWIIADSEHVSGTFDATAEWEEKLVAFFDAALRSGE